MAGCLGNGARRRGARQVLCGLLPVLSAPIEQRPKDMGPGMELRFRGSAVAPERGSGGQSTSGLWGLRGV